MPTTGETLKPTTTWYIVKGSSGLVPSLQVHKLVASVLLSISGDEDVIPKNTSAACDHAICESNLALRSARTSQLD